MKSPLNFIKVAQGPTTKVYMHMLCGRCARVEITHVEMKPIIFRNFHSNKI